MAAVAQMASTNILVRVHQVMWEHDVKQVSVVERFIRKELGKFRSVRVKNEETERVSDG